MNRRVLLQIANDIGKQLIEDFTATVGWLTRLKEHHGIVYKKLCGERMDSDSHVADNWIHAKWGNEMENYKPEKVFNTNETWRYCRVGISNVF